MNYIHSIKNIFNRQVISPFYIICLFQNPNNIRTDLLSILNSNLKDWIWGGGNSPLPLGMRLKAGKGQFCEHFQKSVSLHII